MGRSNKKKKANAKPVAAAASTKTPSAPVTQLVNDPKDVVSGRFLPNLSLSLLWVGKPNADFHHESKEEKKGKTPKV